MRLSSLFIAPLVLLIAAVFPAAHAFSIYSSNSQLDISACTTGFATVYVADAQPGATATFSANGGQFAVSVSPSSSTVSALGTASASVSVSSPACFTGQLPVTLTANVCDQWGCKSQSVQVTVSVSQCAGASACSGSPASAYTANYGNYQPSCFGPSCTFSSSFQSAAYFAPSNYQAAITPEQGVPQCLQAPCTFNQVAPGGSYSTQYSVQNLATGGTFTVQVLSPDNSVSSIVPQYSSFDLANEESTQLTFTIYASPTATPGPHELAVQVLHNGAPVGSTYDWFDVVAPQTTQSALELDLPSSGLSVPACQAGESISIPATLDVAGNGPQEFAVTASIGENQVYSNTVSVTQGISSQFPIVVPAQSLSPGVNLLLVSASSQGLSGNGTVQITLTPCPQPAVALDVKASATGSQVVVNAIITNLGSMPITNVSGALSGLSPAWNYTSSVVPAIAPGQNQTLQLIVNAGDSSQLQPLLTVYSGSWVLSTYQLPLLGGQSSGFTGFAIAGFDSSSLPIYLLILALALIPAYLLLVASRDRPELSGDSQPQPPLEDSTSTYVRKIRNMRHQFPQG
jgi:hypothetical protein